MDIKYYQQYVEEGASTKYQDVGFCALAMVGEVGEVCDVIKKHCIYTDNIDEEYKTKLKDELGDVLWQYTALVNCVGLTFEEIIDYNVNKLNERHGGATLDKTGGKR